MATRLELMRKQRAQLDARIKKTEAAEKSRRRKQDTQRKILVGHFTLEKAKADGSLDTLYADMREYLTREADIKLPGYAH